VRFVVVGDPVAHSRSPAIHNAAFEASDVDAEFGFMRVPADRFEEVVDELRSGVLDGVSVTMPHKNNAFAAVDERSQDALRTGAVNTIVVEEGILVGYNTDVAGVRHALATVETDQTAPILILGTGGAASAALLAVEGRRVFVSGRHESKARFMSERVEVDSEILPWGSPVAMATVINATPLGMAGEQLPDGIVERAGALVDMTYGTDRSPAVAHALVLGLPTADGLTMLVGQAVKAYELFTGLDAPTERMELAARVRS
jgi:shikimate dehydrogenase